MSFFTREEFFERIGRLLDRRTIKEVADDELTAILGVATYVHDTIINELEHRGLLEELDGHPNIPYDLPEEVEAPETILTR